MPDSCIMLIYSERSGSNLLRTLLGNHSEISAPVAPHLLDSFSPFILNYKNLSESSNMIKLLGDMLSLVNHSYHNWNLLTSPQKILSTYHPKTLIEAFDSIYRAKSKIENKKYYVSKDNHLFNYAFQIKEILPGAKFVYLYRDPRDHVASWMRTPLFMHTPYQIIRKWVNEQQKCIMLENSYGFDLHHIRYEDLITKPEKTMTELQLFLEIPVQEECFNTNPDNIEANRNEYWKNLKKPIIKNNQKKYLQKISQNDLLIIESIAKNEMKYLEYELDTIANWANQGSYLFKVQQRIRTTRSKRKHKKLFHDDMSLLQDKLQLLNEINIASLNQ